MKGGGECDGAVNNIIDGANEQPWESCGKRPSNFYTTHLCITMAT